MSLLIYTIADEKYAEYVPLFRYCASRACECDVRVDLISSNEDQPYMAACLRLLIDPSYQQHDYVYITDVDMMLLPCDIAGFHTQEMKKTGLCYSNVPRKNSEQRGEERMTGLHFVNKEWYTKTRDIRTSYLNARVGKEKIEDELMLMDICKALGPIPPTSYLIERHHGIHLGTIRDFQWAHWVHIENQLRRRVTAPQAQQWLDYYKEPQFRDIATHIGDYKIAEQLEILWKFCNKRINEQ